MSIKQAFLLALTVVVGSLGPDSFAHAGELPRARPEEVGLSADRLADFDRFYAAKVERGEMAGIVTLVSATR